MVSAVSTSDLNLDSCVQEPVRLPGSIQPHGTLVVVDPNGRRVVQASANAPALLGLSLAERAGESAETTVTESESLQAPYARISRFIEDLPACKDIAELCTAATREFRQITGSDRVLIYRFDAQGNGEVLAADGDGVPGTREFLSISLLVDGCSWGRVACHSTSPRPVNAQLRTACDLLGKVLSQHIGTRELAALISQLQRSNQELEAFSYSVSHDLRAPFRHIVGYTQLLREREQRLSEQSLHYLDSINEAAKAAGQLVDNLLSFSQLGRTELSMSPVDMQKIVQEIVRSVEPDVRGRQIEWRIHSLPSANGDAALLRQALYNLVENALKYSRERAPAIIEISGEQHASECVYVVRDNGVGFDMAYAHKLFAAFQRLHRMEDFSGTGIGLALTHRIIERHGGWIEARGAVDQGAEFRFGIPCTEKD